MPIEAGFGHQFDEQVAFFRAKLNLPTARWDDIRLAAHDRAFVVAGAMKADLLTDLRDAVDKVIADGIGIEAFRKDFVGIVARHGWTKYTGSATEAGRAWRTRVIYQTNMLASHAAGRWQQLTDPDLLAVRPFWRYIHNDSVTSPRALHKQWGDTGLTLRHDHPFWQTHFPPNGWGCRCRIKAVRGPAEGDATAPPEGWDEHDPKTGAPAGIDKGWDYAPGASVTRLDTLRAQVAEKLPALDSVLAKNLAADLAHPPAGASADEPKPKGAKTAPPVPVEIVRSTEKAHLVKAADGRETWIQKRWLKDGAVAAATFERGAAEMAGRARDLAARKAFKNEPQPLGAIARETEKAVAIQARWEEPASDQSGARLVWFPKSQVRDGAAPGWLIEAKARELRDSLTSQYVTFKIDIGGHAFWM